MLPSLESDIKKVTFAQIKQLLGEKQGVVIAHYYVHPDIQDLADETGGYVGDSLGMARFGSHHASPLLIVAGVKFMGETAKILSPHKTVLVPTLAADCSLDFSCPEEEFRQFCRKHSARTVVVYANTSAKIKALADWVVTSSNALAIVSYLHRRGESILWASDRYLGSYIQRETGADMLLWPGSCIVHDRFRAQGIMQLKNLYPAAAVLVHPESPMEVIELADVVGSTSQLIAAASDMPNELFIVATERGVLHKMQQISPGKQFIIAPTGGSAVCKSCAKCPWMAMNTLQGIENSLMIGREEILLSDRIIERAFIPLERMLKFCE